MSSPTCSNTFVACRVIVWVVHKRFLDVLFSLPQIPSFLFCLLLFYTTRYLSKGLQNGVDTAGFSVGSESLFKLDIFKLTIP